MNVECNLAFSRKQDSQISKVEIKDDMKKIAKTLYKLVGSDDINATHESFIIVVSLLKVILYVTINMDEKESLLKIVNELDHLAGSDFDSEQLLDILLVLLYYAFLL